MCFLILMLPNLQTPLATFPVKLEPSVIAVGPLHVAISMNNRAWFYELHRDGSKLRFGDTCK